MLKYVLFAVSFVSSSAFADCVVDGKDVFDQPSVFLQAIDDARTCDKAKSLAKSCAYGSSLDEITAGIAYAVCEVEFYRYFPDNSDEALLEKDIEECASNYGGKQGTIYLSMQAYCNLDAIASALLAKAK